MKPRRPTLLGLSPALPFTLYWWQLRRRAVQELLAASGIAVGVALVFGVLVANTSVSGSVKGLVHQLVGSAQLQLAARSPEGFAEKLVGRVEAVPGVDAASPILRGNVTLTNSTGRSTVVQLIGVTSRQFLLNPNAANDLGSGAESLVSGGVALPEAVARTLAVRPEDMVAVRANGRTRWVHVRIVLGSEAVGAVANSPIAVSTLFTAQQLTGMGGRITDALVRAKPHAEQSVTHELTRIAAGKLNVTPADNELRMFEAAVRPNEQSTTLFAAIAGMVGFLLALNAMLMTVPERRRLVAELQTFGYGPAQVVLLMSVQAIVLGMFGSAVGIAAGLALAHTLFGTVPSYLTTAFPIGSAQIVTAPTLLIAVASGVIAALIASVRPLLDLRHRTAVDSVMREEGEAGQRVRRRTVLVAGASALALALVVTIGALSAPVLTLVGGVVLAISAVCLVPLAYTSTLRVLRRSAERSRGALAIAHVELEATATRSIALAAIAALATYGSVAVGGARSDLIRGLETAIHEDSAPAQVWVTSGDNVFNTTSFPLRDAIAKIAHVPGIASVRVDQGALLDVGHRRLLIRAHSPSDPVLIQPSQLLAGGLARASALIRRGGWATVSQGLAGERHLHIGEPFMLPTPSGALRLRVAAITTNLGWPAGAVTLSLADYTRGWLSANPSALEVVQSQNVSPAFGRRAVQNALGASGLQVQTDSERESQADSELRQGLGSLGRISLLILMTGALAMAASLSAAIWQRRARLAAMKTWGYDYLQLWRSLLLESSIVTAIGCVVGAILGCFAHALADRWLRLTTDFPAPFSIGGPTIILALTLVVSVALAVVAAPGLSAARVSPSLSFQE